MLRIVDVGAALAARGYPRGLSGEIHLDVCDDVIVSNNGRYVLEVADGKGHISTGGKGDLRIDERGLAALYSGFKTPSELIALGQLSVDSRAHGESLELARSVFASSESSMCDAF